MAKELPYFKFEPNQWENGNIQICTRADKGLFLDLCCMYWSRLGDVPLKLAVQKLCGGDTMAFDSLLGEQIFMIKDEFIIIDFLDEQLKGFKNISNKNRKNALKRWTKDAVSLNSHSQNNTIREEKKKEDKIRVNDINKRIVGFRKSLHLFTDKYGLLMLQDFSDYWTEHGEKDKKLRFEKEKSFGLSRRLSVWFKNQKNWKKEKSSDKKENAGELLIKEIQDGINN